MHGYRDRLVPLDRLPLLSSLRGTPDARGWDVYASDGDKVGRLDDLVVDTGGMRVRYLDVSLDDAAASEVAHESHLLIPVGRAQLDVWQRRIRLDGLGRDDVLSLPAYLHMPPAPEYETALRRRFEPTYAGDALDDAFFATVLYDQDHFFGCDRPTTQRA